MLQLVYRKFLWRNTLKNFRITYFDILMKMQNQEKKEILPKENLFYLDFLKCIAIIFVVFYHTGALNNNIFRHPSIATYVFYFISPLVGTCVPIFFFVSGYLLLNKPVTLPKLISKIKKLVILIIFWRIVTFPIIYLIRGDNFTTMSVIKDMFDFKSGYTNHLWYLIAMIGIYVLYPLLKNAFDNNIDYFMFFLISITMLTFGTKLITQSINMIMFFVNKKLIFEIPYNNFISEFNVFASTRGFGIVYFMLGGLIYQWSKLLKRRSQILYIFNILLCMSLQFAYNVVATHINNNFYDPVWWSYDNIFTIFLLLNLYFLIKNIELKNLILKRFVTIIGKNSLGIYLIHNILFQITKNNVNSLFLNHNSYKFLYSIFIVLISLCLVLIIKKIPFLNKVISF